MFDEKKLKVRNASQNRSSHFKDMGRESGEFLKFLIHNKS